MATAPRAPGLEEDFVAQELKTPGRFKSVALAGQEFATRLLNPRSTLHYTALLLAEYDRRYNAPGPR